MMDDEIADLHLMGLGVREAKHRGKREGDGDGDLLEQFHSGFPFM